MDTAKQIQNIGAAVVDMSLSISLRCGNLNGGDGTPTTAMLDAQTQLSERTMHAMQLAAHANDSVLWAQKHVQAVEEIVTAGNLYLAASLLVVALERAVRGNLDDHQMARDAITNAAKLIGVG